MRTMWTWKACFTRPRPSGQTIPSPKTRRRPKKVRVVCVIWTALEDDGFSRLLFESTVRARWAQLLEAAHQHVESSQEGLEIAPVPRTLFRHGSMDSDCRPRICSTDFRPMQRSTSTDTEVFEDLR